MSCTAHWIWHQYQNAIGIVIAGGGHTTLNVGTEGADFVSYLYQYGITSIILRNRMRVDEKHTTQTDSNLRRATQRSG